MKVQGGESQTRQQPAIGFLGFYVSLLTASFVLAWFYLRSPSALPPRLGGGATSAPAKPLVGGAFGLDNRVAYKGLGAVGAHKLRPPCAPETQKSSQMDPDSTRFS